MRTRQLSLMVRDLRAEAGHALGVAQGVNNYETLKYLLARTQEELWTAFTWPDLGVRADVVMVAGQYLYPWPTTPVAMTYDMVRETWTADAGTADWCPVAYGIDESMVLPGGLNNATRSDPVQAWGVEGEMFRVYPTPDAGGNWVRFTGQKQLAPFVADSDVSTIDATCIVLFTSADLLARAKAEDAASKMQKAQRHLTKLLGNKISTKNRAVTLGGGSPAYSNRRGYLHYGNG